MLFPILDFVRSRFYPIRDFVQFRILSIRDYAQLGILSVRNFFHSGFCLFGILFSGFGLQFNEAARWVATLYVTTLRWIVVFYSINTVAWFDAVFVLAHQLLFQFSISIALIFITELILGILGFAYKDWFRAKFSSFVNKTIRDYRSDPDLQDVIDFTQSYVSTNQVKNTFFCKNMKLIFAQNLKTN